MDAPEKHQLQVTMKSAVGDTDRHTKDMKIQKEERISVLDHNSCLSFILISVDSFLLIGQ